MKNWPAFLLLVAAVSSSSRGQVAVTTYHNNNARTGANLNETLLTPANVNSTQFGKLFAHPVDGYIFAQPLYLPRVRIRHRGVHNVVYVVTEHDSVYAFDADHWTRRSSRPLWKRSFLDAKRGVTSVSSADVNCTDLVPEIGITGTPVIDQSTHTMYMVAKTKEDGVFVQRLHALDVATGAEKFGGPVTIEAVVKGSGDGTDTVAFNPLTEGQRAGLLLQDGTVYIGWASHCDRGPFHGWVIGYDAGSLRKSGVWNSTPDGTEGGVWQSGGAMAAESTEHGSSIYLATGNGTFDAQDAMPRDLGDSIVKLVARRGEPRPEDYFTPYDQAAFDAGDRDLGAGGVMLIPNQENAPHRHLLVEGGKDGSLYLVDRDHMGHFDPDGNGQIVQFLPNVVGGVFSTPAWWNHNLYVGGSGDYLKQFILDPTSGMLAGAPASSSSTLFPARAPTPSISADQRKNAIVWAIEVDSVFNQGSSILHAYDATDLSREPYNSEQEPERDSAGGGVKFSVPTIANGKVYVGTSAELDVYGLLPAPVSSKKSRTTEFKTLF